MSRGCNIVARSLWRKYQLILITPIKMNYLLSIKSIAVTLLLFLTSILQAQETGSVGGIIIEQKSKEPIMGATVQLNGSNIGAVTDLDGKFIIENIPVGSYNIEIRYIGFSNIDLKGIAVAKGKVTAINAEMVEENIHLEGIVVVAQIRKNSDLALMQATRTALTVQSGISAQQIARTQDRDASEVVRRIPGISIIDGKFVNVRGLAQRYNNVWINNSAVPSSEADSRAFSFDLIPSSQLDNMMIVKSPTPELPADFAGGFVKINTKDVPNENSTQISVGGSANSATHFTSFKEAVGSSTDFFGFDNGMRKMPGGFNERMTNSSSSQVDWVTKNGFNNNWKVNQFSPVGDLRLNAALNRRWKMDNGRQWALIGSVNYTNSYTTQANMKNARYGVYNSKEDKPEYYNDYTDNVYSHNARVGGMLNFTYLVSDKDKYEFKNIFNQLGQNRYTERQGYQWISAKYNQEKQEYYYNSRTTYNGQFTGVHTRGDHKIDWNAGYAFANKNQPDRRIINRQENTDYGDPNIGRMQIDQNEIQREFSKLNEHILSTGINYSLDFNFADMRPTLRAGFYGEYRTREYNTRSFYYRYNQRNLPDDFAFLPVVEEILTPTYFGHDKLYVYEDTDNRNSYSGNNTNLAGYLSLNIPMGKLNINAGVRYEHNKMNMINYTKIKGFDTQTISYPTSDIFPSVNATWKMNEKHQLRLAYGASVNRPEFRERSPFVYYDFDLFSDIKGNPNLKTAYIQNVDFRYEYYPSNTEVISAALFYKHFKNPIEWTFLDAGGSYTYTFENARAANNYGMEVEIRKNLDFIGLKNFGVNFNGSVILSKVMFEENSLEKDRPMQGQSPYLINAGVFYQSEPLRMSVAVMYNRIGKRIVGVGRVDTSQGSTINNDIPDAYEMPRDAIDISFSKHFGKGFELKASVKDLLAQKITFQQYPQFYDAQQVLHERQQITRQFNPGRTFFVSLGYQF